MALRFNLEKAYLRLHRLDSPAYDEVRTRRRRCTQKRTSRRRRRHSNDITPRALGERVVADAVVLRVGRVARVSYRSPASLVRVVFTRIHLYVVPLARALNNHGVPTSSAALDISLVPEHRARAYFEGADRAAPSSGLAGRATPRRPLILARGLPIFERAPPSSLTRSRAPQSARSQLTLPRPCARRARRAGGSAAAARR